MESLADLNRTQAENGILIIFAGILGWWPKLDRPWRKLNAYGWLAFRHVLLPKLQIVDFQNLRPLFQRVRAILRDHRDTLGTLTGVLLDASYLSHEEIEAVVVGGDGAPQPHVTGLQAAGLSIPKCHKSAFCLFHDQGL